MSDLPDLAKTEAAIVQQTNEFRQSEGLDPLARNAALDQAAKSFARFLAKSGRFAHEADGRQAADRVKEAGYWHCTIAENLALNLDSRGFTVERLAAEAMDGWKKSPGHRANMLLEHTTEIGVGIAQAPGPDPKFLSVQLFGRPQSLSYEFQVTNRSQDPVSYTFAGQSHSIEPRTTATHQACEPGWVHFTSSGGWMSRLRMDARYKSRNGARFVLRNGPDGRVRVEMQH